MWLDGTPKWYYTSIAAAAYINQTAGVIVNLQEGHTLATGEGAKVAVIDTAIDRTHIVLWVPSGDGYDLSTTPRAAQERIDTNQETTADSDQETTPILDQETHADSGRRLGRDSAAGEPRRSWIQEATTDSGFEKIPGLGHGTMVAG